MEIDAGTDLPDDIQITVNGETVIVALQYQWLPPICPECKVFGHPQGTCAKQSGPKVSSSEVNWQVVNKGKSKIIGNLVPSEADTSSSSLPTIEESIGIPCELADVPTHPGELQLSTTSNSVPIIPNTSTPQQSSVSPGEEQDSDDELLGVLESVVSSSKVVQDVPPIKESVSLDTVINSAPKAGLSTTEGGPNSAKVVNPSSGVKQPPKPPDLHTDRIKQKIAELEANKSLSKSAKRRMLKQLKEQSLGSLSEGKH